MDIKSFLTGFIVSFVICLLVWIFIDNDDKTNGNKIDQDLYIDTIYVNQPYKPEYNFSDLIPPLLVIKYPTIDSIEVTNVEYHNDTIKLYYHDSTFLSVSPGFLTKFPNSDKLIQLLLTDNEMKLGLLNINGEIFEKVYDIDTYNYSYNYIGNNLTRNSKSFIKKIQPLSSIMWRPFNNLWDLDFGLKYNTRKFNYELGLNMFYYPTIKKNPSGDLYFKLSYSF